MYPHDPLCDRIRWLLRNLTVAQAWHKAVLANSPFAYKTFADNFGNSPYAKVALNLHDASQGRAADLQQRDLMVSAQLAPTLKPGNFGLPKEGTIKLGDTVAPIQGGKLGIALGDKPKLNNAIGNSAAPAWRRQDRHPAWPSADADNGTGNNGTAHRHRRWPRHHAAGDHQRRPPTPASMAERSSPCRGTTVGKAGPV